MSRLLSIFIGAAAGVGLALLLRRRNVRVTDAIKRKARRNAATDDVSLARKVETHIFRPRGRRPAVARPLRRRGPRGPRRDGRQEPAARPGHPGPARPAARRDARPGLTCA